MVKHISCATDDNYAQHCGVMLCSLFENNKESEYVVHILMNQDTLSEQNRDKLRQLVEKYHSECIFHHVDGTKLKGVQYRKNRPLTEAAYYRILYASIFDESIHKIFYLDCDIVVNGKIDEIFDLDISEYGLAAVQDVDMYEDDHRMQMSLPYERCMFCSGVMLINLDYWRENHVEEKLLYYAKKPRHVYLHDQDALNAVFHNKWFRLAPKWNKFNMGYLEDWQFLTKQDKEEFLHNPIIIHFLVLKPWFDIPHLKYKELYYKYLDLTEWKGFVPIRRKNDSQYSLGKMIFLNNMRLWLRQRGMLWVYNMFYYSVMWLKRVILFPYYIVKIFKK